MILSSNLVWLDDITKLWAFEVEESKWQNRQYHTLTQRQETIDYVRTQSGLLIFESSTHKIWTLISWLIEWWLHHFLNAELMARFANIAIMSKIGWNWWITFVAITLAVAGVRSSSLDSERFSPIPFRKCLFRHKKQKLKKLFVDPKQTVLGINDTRWWWYRTTHLQLVSQRK